MSSYALILIIAALCSGWVSLRAEEAEQKGADNPAQNAWEWTPIGEATWRWSGNEVAAIAGGAGGMLATSASFADIRLLIEFNPDGDVNSGVFIRCQDRQDISPFTCYEINIWDHHPNQSFRTGSIVMRSFPPLARLDTIGKWNRLEITARGEHISVRVNDVLTAKLKDSTHASGFIALQREEGGAIRFRNISIEPYP